MDPLSITASTITVLQTVNDIISFCYDYKAALTEQPWSLSRILSQVKAIRTTIEQIDSITVDLSTSSKSIALFSEPLSDCRHELDKLQALLAPSKAAGKARTHRHAIIRALGWRLNEREIEQRLKALARVQATLSLSLTAVDTELLVDIKTTTEIVKTGVQNINTTLQKSISTEQDKKFHQWLSDIDVEAQLIAVSQHRTAGTGEWLLQEDCVRDLLSGDARRLWMIGCSGAGKTVLCSSMVEAATQTGTTAYVFCDFSIKQSRDVVSLLGSLLSQLIHKTRYKPTSLLDAFEEQATGPCHKRPTVELLSHGLQAFNDVFIVVDAIDEVDNPQQFASILSRLPSRTFISSREGRDITDELQDFTRLNLADHSKDISYDIERYVNAQLLQNNRLRTLGDSTKEHVRSVLVNQSASMFRWTQCQLITISGSRTAKQIRSALQGLPAGLDDTYTRILRSVPHQDVELVRKLLTWLAFSVQPMTADEMREALAIAIDDDRIDEEELLTNVEDVFLLCGSLVSVSNSLHLRLAHASVRDYLLSDRIPADLQSFALAEGAAYLELAGNCLTYLGFNEFATGPSTSADAYADRLARHPLARHIATSWPYYVRGGCSIELVIDFFKMKEHFMAWVQILNGDYGFKWNIYPPHATPLYYASTFGLHAIVEHLLQHSPDLDAPGSRYGGTALHGAAYRGHQAVVALLLEAGADPNKVDWHRVAPLHSATEREDEALIQLLLDYGASTKLRDVTGETPIDRANRHKNEKVLTMLREADAVSSSATSRTASYLTASPNEELRFWSKPVHSLPSIYDKRSGLESSIVLAVEFVHRLHHYR